MNNGRSKVYGSYGRFYTTVPQDIQTRALGSEVHDHRRTTTRTRTRSTRSPEPASASRRRGDLINPEGLKGMYQDEIIVGVEYEFFRNWSFGVKGIYKTLGRVLEDRCDIPYNADLSNILNSNDPYIKAYQPTCALINVGEGGLLNTIKDPNDKTCYPNGATIGHAARTTATSRRLHAGRPQLPRPRARPHAPLREQLLRPRELHLLEARGELLGQPVADA